MKIRQYPIIKGDSLSISIACASIIAKVERDQSMQAYDGMYPGYGFARHKGYATREHIIAVKNIGPTPIHRGSFEPVKLIGGSNPRNLEIATFALARGIVNREALTALASFLSPETNKAQLITVLN